MHKASLALLGAALFATSAGGAFAQAAGSPEIRFWTDVSPANCAEHARAKVVSTKAAKNGDVSVKVKLKDGKSHTSTVNKAKAEFFPVGSDFCAQDL
jgi:ABC-type glycerol-3-phosphate transport system substrate-binding protein